MKTNELHNQLKALKAAPTLMPRHQRALKSALLNYQAPKQTLALRFQAAFKNLIGVTMSHKKTFFGASTLAITAVFVLSIAAYNYRFSPRAEAEQLVGQSIGLVRTFNNSQMGKLQAQLGGDPVKELKEAQQAKDLTVLSPEEFKAESAKHKGVMMSSLGKDGPQYGSVGISGGGDAPSNIMNQHFSTSLPESQAGSGTSTVTVNNGPESGVTSSGPQHGSQKMLQFQADGSNKPSTDQSGPVSFVPVNPAKYLRYTNTTGHVVVLGLDDKGVPINKTIFMTDAEVQNMQH